MKKAPPCHDLLAPSSADWATSSLKFPSIAHKQRYNDGAQQRGVKEKSYGEEQTFIYWSYTLVTTNPPAAQLNAITPKVKLKKTAQLPPGGWPPAVPLYLYYTK